MNIYSEKSISYLKQKHGEVQNAVVMKDDQERNYGFISMKSHEFAERAKRELNNSKIGGKNVIYDVNNILELSNK